MSVTFRACGLCDTVFRDCDVCVTFRYLDVSSPFLPILPSVFSLSLSPLSFAPAASPYNSTLHCSCHSAVCKGVSHVVKLFLWLTDHSLLVSMCSHVSVTAVSADVWRPVVGWIRTNVLTVVPWRWAAGLSETSAVSTKVHSEVSRIQ